MAVDERRAFGLQSREAVRAEERLPALEIVAAHLVEDDQDDELHTRRPDFNRLGALVFERETDDRRDNRKHSDERNRAAHGDSARRSDWACGVF